MVLVGALTPGYGLIKPLVKERPGAAPELQFRAPSRFPELYRKVPLKLRKQLYVSKRYSEPISIFVLLKFSIFIVLFFLYDF